MQSVHPTFAFRLKAGLWPITSLLVCAFVGFFAGFAAGADTAESSSAYVDPSDPEAGKSHWAFQPLARTAPPETRNADWAKSPIDRFVLARLEQHDLAPAADAEPGDLLRRVCFLLTGLPPSPEEVQRFCDDPSPQAWEALVDRLLASTHFGERWGRHWLDLARYADSNGLDENFLLREAWRYRNWVIGAVNADMPFDRFVLEQLAGDLLPFDSIPQRDSQRIAAGFLVVGPKVLLNDDAQKQRMEVADELIDTLGRALLAQTLGCSRCHDHKFDPFPTADYYSLAGIFTSTRVMERRYMLGEQRTMERLVGLGEQGDALDEAYEKFWREQPERTEQAKQAKAVLEALKKDDPTEAAALLEKSPQAFAEAAKDAARPLPERVAAQEALVAQLVGELSKPPPIPPRAMIPADAESPADEAVRLSGQFDKLGATVPRGFPRVLCDSQPVAIEPSSSGRIALAHWLTDPRGRAGQLTARVMANRVWLHLIGRGIVPTVDNFGRTGETPTHPELLDYLAGELIDSGWSIKSLVRSIVTSRTFALSTQGLAPNIARDPDNRLLWRAHRRRLDPESLRDAMLTAAGELDLAPRQSTVWYLGDQATAVGDNKVRRRTDFPCRSVYLPVIRNDLPELFQVFDFADPHATTGDRPRTTVPTQGLFLLNDVQVMDAAEQTARRLLAEPASSTEERIDRLFQRVVHRPPTPQERAAMAEYLQSTEALLRQQAETTAELSAGADAQRRAWATACHALFASSSFQHLE